MLHLNAAPRVTPRAQRSGPLILGCIWDMRFKALGREPQIPLNETFVNPVFVPRVMASRIKGIIDRIVRTHADGYRREQSILLVRAGEEDGFSAPISFDSLTDTALPLARTEDMGRSMLFESLCKLAFVSWLHSYFVKKLLSQTRS
ncbi:uncharacterized protein LY89DRAFT_666416 [Mollisia scopiformis]|uniref:Uncharacterized protein n=1 Tax=Mollisia scopiformis TaxID=149040 RepID=A0A194XL06_MOLSC|nr:uncharacterized protein LY89DRAFT_666416 [Mollisia scopiformis]KUJ20779.1 hypothetical protein LY89DRAFT_666416 [Mollisia scopiformis]